MTSLYLHDHSFASSCHILVVFTKLKVKLLSLQYSAGASPCALLGGFRGILPRENFLNRCNLVRFRVYFDHILFPMHNEAFSKTVYAVLAELLHFLEN